MLDLMQEDFQAKWLLMTAEVERGTRKDSHKLSSREEDPAWFQDISSSARTKEEVMFRSCSARVRGYLARAEQQLGESPCSKADALCLATVVGNSSYIDSRLFLSSLTTFNISPIFTNRVIVNICSARRV